MDGRKVHILTTDQPSEKCEGCGRTIIKSHGIGAPLYTTHKADYMALSVDVRCSPPSEEEKDVKRIHISASTWR